jgi:hypothetical protein
VARTYQGEDFLSTFIHWFIHIEFSFKIEAGRQLRHWSGHGVRKKAELEAYAWAEPLI